MYVNSSKTGGEKTGRIKLDEKLNLIGARVQYKNYVIYENFEI